jgi:hypothetical protein
MNLDSQSWTCRGCGGGFIGRKPLGLICTQCTASQWPCNRCGATCYGTAPTLPLCPACAAQPGSAGWLYPLGQHPDLDALRCLTCGALPIRDLTALLHDAYQAGAHSTRTHPGRPADEGLIPHDT